MFNPSFLALLALVRLAVYFNAEYNIMHSNEHLGYSSFNRRSVYEAAEEAGP